MAEKIYCGAKLTIPKGYRRGTAEECINKNQIRLYGLNQIDMNLYNKVKGSKVTKDKAKKIYDKIKDTIVKYRVRRRKAEEIMQYTKNIEENKAKIEKAKMDFEKYTNDLRTLLDNKKYLMETYGFEQ